MRIAALLYALAALTSWFMLFTPSVLLICVGLGVDVSSIPGPFRQELSAFYISWGTFGIVLFGIRFFLRRWLVELAKNSEPSLAAVHNVRTILGMILSLLGFLLPENLDVLGLAFYSLLCVLLLSEERLIFDMDVFGVATLFVETLPIAVIQICWEANEVPMKSIVLAPPIALATLSIFCRDVLGREERHWVMMVNLTETETQRFDTMTFQHRVHELEGAVQSIKELIEGCIDNPPTVSGQNRQRRRKIMKSLKKIQEHTNTLFPMVRSARCNTDHLVKGTGASEQALALQRSSHTIARGGA